VNEFRFDPETYPATIRADIPVYDELQRAVADASVGLDARRVLDLGVGTGETARLVLRAHPAAELVGIDENEQMLAVARSRLEADLRRARLEDVLPEGPFDLVVSCLAVHHLDADGKRDLFRRLASALRPGGRLVLGDVVVPDRPDDAATPTTPGFDRPDRLDDQLRWLDEAGFSAETTWAWKDVAVIRADRRSSYSH
jgi:tRNA (cmo5U34)-methyltransferase